MNVIVIDERPADVGPGAELVLSAAQHGLRRHQCEVLQQLKDGQVHVRMTAPTQFKIGETLGWAGDVPKGLRHVLVAPAPVSVQVPPPAKREKAEKRDANGDTPEMAAMRKQFDASWAKQREELEAAKAAVDKARAEGVAEGRRQMLAEVERRNALFEAEDGARDLLEAAEAAIAKAGEGADLDALDAARLAAADTLAKAEAAVAALEPLKA